MIPHHQAAIDITKAFLIYGKDPALERLAKESIVTHGAQIHVLQTRLKALQADSRVRSGE